jgi:hypothetical protein
MDVVADLSDGVESVTNGHDWCGQRRNHRSG